MYGSSKEQFDANFETLRKLFLKKEVTKERVLRWIKEEGQRVKASQAEMRNKFTKTRAGRDVDALNKIMERLEKEDE